MVPATIALALLLPVSQARSRTVPKPQPEPPTVDALLALPSVDFRQALLAFRVPNAASPSDLAPIVDRCWDELLPMELSPERSWYESAFACERIAERLAEMASDPTSLVARLKDHKAGPLRRGLVNGLFTARIQKAIERLSDMPPEPPEPATPKPSLPGRLANVPRALQEAYLLRQGLASLDEARRSVAESDVIGAHEHWEDFESSVDDVLTGRLDPERGGAALARYKWERGFGHRAEAFFDWQSRAALLADLVAGRRRSAAARYPDLMAHEPGDDGGVRLVRGLLDAAGVDWEQAFVGDVLGGSTRAATNLARHASPRVAPLLLAIADLPPAEDDDGDEVDSSFDEPWFWTPLAAFVRPGSACESSIAPELPSRDPEAGFAAPADEVRILEQMGHHVARAVGLQEAEDAAGLLARACREESRPVLREMLRSPYQRVRELGATTLQAMGKRVPPVRPTPPVRFRLLVDKVPWPQTLVTYELQGNDGNWFRSSATTTDLKGRFNLPGDPFRDTKQVVARIRLRVDVDPADSTGAIPHLIAQVPRPPATSRVTDVAVTTQVLSIGCERMNDGRGNLQLLPHDPTARGVTFPSWGLFPRSGLARVRIARGRYHLLLVHPGSGGWSTDVEIGDAPVTVECGELKSEKIELPSEP